MGKRIMAVVVGAGMGALAGLLLSFVGLGNAGIFAGAVVGGVVPIVALGKPGR